MARKRGAAFREAEIRPGGGPALKIEIYSKPDCGLCDEAKAVIAEARKQMPFDVIETNIETDPALLAEFRFDIPVIFVDGHKAFKHRLTLPALLERLRRI